jgi:heme/copper-type cytochrome/quinol oxidase subunit 2
MLKPRYVAVVIGVLLIVVIAVATYRRSASQAPTANPNASTVPLTTGTGPGKDQ